MRRECSILSDLVLVEAGRSEYEELAGFHYRDGGCGPRAAVYAMIDKHYAATRKDRVAGVIVYSMGAANMEMRNVALGGVFGGGSRRDELSLVNKNIRCISRVIVEPRYRGMGVASRMVSESMQLIDVPVVEAMAVMGRVNPFFERAGMKRFEPGVSVKAARMIEALGLVGISEDDFIDAEKVYERVEQLHQSERRFVNGEIEKFVQTYGKRRYMGDGVDRMRFVLSKVVYRPVYYVWVNRHKGIGIGE